jgi:hypothetical protein
LAIQIHVWLKSFKRQRSQVGKVYPMKLIPLTQGKVARVDDRDYEGLVKFKWYAHRGHQTFYAKRNCGKPGGERKTVYMHRLILNAPNSLIVDHVDGDGLNNQNVNLRICSYAENIRNQRVLNRGNTTGYRGVSPCTPGGQYRATIQVNRKQVHLGVFSSALKASRAFDEAARKYFGAFYRPIKVEELLCRKET